MVVPVLLAAGEGKRMRSTLPKVMHCISGEPMIRRVMDAVSVKDAEKPVVVVGHMAEVVMAALGDSARYALQDRQLGTGHAVMAARAFLVDDSNAPLDGFALIVAGDMPLVRKRTIRALIDATENSGRAATILSAVIDDPKGYGRIVRDENGALARIVEERDATEEQRRIHEVNSLVYCVRIKELLWALDRLTTNNEQEEYYLTDCVKLFVQTGRGVDAYTAPDNTECLGVNDPEQLAYCEKIFEGRTSDDR